MTVESIEFSSDSAATTEALGFALAALLPAGALVALRGELAAGKTCFTRGMARRLAPECVVTSPTFTLINEYEGSRTLLHVDLYRLESLDDVRGLGHEEIFTPGEAIAVIEWADRAEELLPPVRVDVTFEHTGGDTRRIVINNRGVLASDWQTVLQEAAGSAP